jgi:O-antigen/teichoic acid export membrane protein
LLCSTIDSSLIALGEVRYTTVGNLFRLIMTVAGILIGYKLIGVVGAVIAVALNDVLYYVSISVGLYREGLSCLRQDAVITALLLITVALILGGRALLGIDFFGWDMLEASLVTFGH